MLGDRHVTAGCGMSCYAAIYVTICAQGQRDRIAAVWRSGEQNNVQPRMVSGSDLSASDLIPDRSAASRRVLLHAMEDSHRNIIFYVICNVLKLL